MKNIVDNESVLMQAAHQMDLISKTHCLLTECTQNRMRSIENDYNCEWYHGAWMYCRLSGIVVSNDYLGNSYQFFFEKYNAKPCNILICGTADFAILEHILQSIPKRNRKQTYITIIDICNSPLLLCQWFINTYHQEYAENIKLIQANAINLPFEDHSFDLITTYSFLTRMIFNDAKKVVKEWYRVLKPNGTVLTTVHISDFKEFEGNFYRSDLASEQFALNKLEQFLNQNTFELSYAETIRCKVVRYISNIMSVAMSNENLKELFKRFTYNISYFDQPGELEDVHKMAIVNAVKEIIK